MPKLIEISIGGFSPIHEQHLGWDENGRFGHSETTKSEEGGDVRVYKDNFPYGASTAAGGESYAVAVGQPNTDFPKPAYSEDELSKDERAQAEAAIANAQARYGGMFGNMRKKKDEKKAY